MISYKLKVLVFTFAAPSHNGNTEVAIFQESHCKTLPDYNSDTNLHIDTDSKHSSIINQLTKLDLHLSFYTS